MEFLYPHELVYAQENYTLFDLISLGLSILIFDFDILIQQLSKQPHSTDSLLLVQKSVI